MPALGLGEMATAGMHLSVLTYPHAIIAALQGDEVAAQVKFARALDAGWLDAQAQQRYLVWRRYVNNE